MSLPPQIKNDDGWITLDTMLKFKRLASISSDKAVIAAALRNSTPSFIEVFIIDTSSSWSEMKRVQIFIVLSYWQCFCMAFFLVLFYLQGYSRILLCDFYVV